MVVGIAGRCRVGVEDARGVFTLHNSFDAKEREGRVEKREESFVLNAVAVGPAKGYSSYRLTVLPSILAERIVRVAVQPPLARFGRRDDGVAGGAGVFGGVAIG